MFYCLATLVRLVVAESKERRKKTICFFSPFFPANAGYHWRVEKWAAILKENGFKVNIFTAISKEDFYNYHQDNTALFFIKFLQKRFWQVIQSAKFETVIVRRELLLFNDYGNLFLDKLLLKFHPNAILDFDDDIAFSKGEPREIESLYGKILLENGNKFTETIRLYKRFQVATNYLKELVLSVNPEIRSHNICVLPTCVDYDRFEMKKYNLEKEEVIFGWVGGNHNLFLLNEIIEPLNRLSVEFNIQLLVISGRDYVNEKAKFKIINRQWSLDTEVEDIQCIDIGLMPLLNTNRDKGKAGFKLIQYMGMGVVSVASAITVNKSIIENGVSGFLVDTDQSWQDVLIKVIESRCRFDEIGFNACIKVLRNYSFTANQNIYISFLKKTNKNLL